MEHLILNYRLFRIWQYLDMPFYAVILIFSILYQMTIVNGFRLKQLWDVLEICLKNKDNWSHILLPKKSSFRMKLISVFLGTLISISAVFGAQKINMWSYKSLCTHYERLLERRHRCPNYCGQ